MLKFVIKHGKNIYVIRNPYDLYELYNDFYIADSLFKRSVLRQTIILIRENCQFIYSNLIADYYTIAKFEKAALKLLKENNLNYTIDEDEDEDDYESEECANDPIWDEVDYFNHKDD